LDTHSEPQANGVPSNLLTVGGEYLPVSRRRAQGRGPARRPRCGGMEAAVPVVQAGPDVAAVVAEMPARAPRQALARPINRFKRNVPVPQINREIFSRRNLPHKDIWLVAPFIDGHLFAPTAAFGKLLLDQVEDGASVVIITAPPKDQKIDWMEKLVTTMQQVIEEVRLAGHDPAEGPVSVDFLDEHEIVEEVLGGGGVA
jgi:hypothetical protein